jgi:hypothetical protein
MPTKKRTPVTCADCFFRQERLCALTGDVPCPTFRASTRGALEPPQQPRLVPRVLRPVQVGQAA